MNDTMTEYLTDKAIFEKVPTGNAMLDELLGGGVEADFPVVIISSHKNKPLVNALKGKVELKVVGHEYFKENSGVLWRYAGIIIDANGAMLENRQTGRYRLSKKHKALTTK